MPRPRSILLGDSPAPATTTVVKLVRAKPAGPVSKGIKIRKKKA